MATITVTNGESKDNTLSNKIRALRDILELSPHAKHDEIAFFKAVEKVVNAYTQHPDTSTLKESQISSKMWFWLLMDLFEWRWKSKIKDLFPWWQFIHNTLDHYTIEPKEYICPEERLKMVETSHNDPAYHTIYNVPDEHSAKLTYWDVFGVNPNFDHSELVNYFTNRECPKDLDEFVFCWAENDKKLLDDYQKWALRGLTDTIIDETESIVGIPMNGLPVIRRQATWPGKFYKNSHACPPREQDDVITILSGIVAPKWVHNFCTLEEEGPIDNLIWESINLPAGKEWMVDVIWANLTHAERLQICSLHNNWINSGGNFDCYIQYWLYLQLNYNWGNCFTTESKNLICNIYLKKENLISQEFKNYKWMMEPRKATW